MTCAYCGKSKAEHGAGQMVIHYGNPPLTFLSLQCRIEHLKDLMFTDIKNRHANGRSEERQKRKSR